MVFYHTPPCTPLQCGSDLHPLMFELNFLEIVLSNNIVLGNHIGYRPPLLCGSDPDPLKPDTRVLFPPAEGLRGVPACVG